MDELCEILSQVIIHHLHAVLLHDAHQDRLDDLIAKVYAHTLPRTQPEPPIRITVLSRGELTEAIGSENVSVGAPDRSIAVERASVDEDGGLWRDVIPVNDLRIGRQLRERVEQDWMQATGFEIAVVEEGVGLADVCISPVFAVGTKGFVREGSVDLFVESGHDRWVHCDFSGDP